LRHEDYSPIYGEAERLDCTLGVRATGNKAGRIFIGCEGDEPALAYAVKEVGSEPFLYSSDFPHEVNTDTCKEEIQELLDNEEITEEAKMDVLHENSRRFYQI